MSIITSNSPRKALIKLISAHFALFGAAQYMADAIAEINQTFADFAPKVIDFVGAYRARFQHRNNGQIYDATIGNIAEIVIDKTINGSKKQRVPMLPELQKAVERRGYSFTLLRGTSYLCEVQISAK
jgi:hypothetical protein